MNFKKMSAKVMAVLMAVFMFTGVFAPAVSAADAHDYLDRIDGYRNEYEDLYNGFINDFETNYNKVYEKLEFLVDNYDEIYAEKYQEAVANGTIAAIVAYLEEAKTYVDFAKDFVLDYEEYFRSEDLDEQIVEATANANATIDALISLIKNADKLDAETCEKAMNLLVALEANVADIATLINTVAEDAYEYALPYVQEALVILNAKINEVLETVAKVENEVKAIVAEYLTVIEAAIKDFLANSAFDADYTVSDDSYLLAIGSNSAYAEILAGKLGIADDQFGTMAWDNLDSSIIAKADLITIGYDASKFVNFTIDQLVAFATNYVNVNLRNDANEYVEDAINHFFGNLSFINPTFIEGIVADVQKELNAKLDEVLGNEMIPTVEKSDLDWAALVGEENVAFVEGIIDSIVNEIEATGALNNALNGIEGVENGMIKIEVIKLFLDSVDEEVLAFVDTENLEAMFGDYANYVIELPVAEVAALAIESYLYSYIQFNVEYAQTVYAINVINPNAKVILLSGYNVFDGKGFELTIGDIVIDLGEIFTSDLQDSANSVIDTVYGELFGILNKAVAEETIDAVLPVLDTIIADLCAQIRAAQKMGAEFDVEAAINSIDYEAILAAVATEENITYALKFVAAVMFVLEKTGTLETVVDTVVDNKPTEEEMAAILETVMVELEKLANNVEAGFENLDNAVVDGLTTIYLTLPEIRVILSDLDSYVAVAEKEALKIQDLFNSIYDAIEDYDIVIKGTTIDLGAIFGSVTPGTTSIHSLVYAFSMKNVIFVNIADVEIVADTLSMADFILGFIYDNDVTGATEAGLAYIAEQIYNALNVTCDHVDYDKDHACDFCGMEMGEHVDADKDHFCDYGCSEKIGEHADANKDHKCDYGCSEKIGDHADADKDHKCDYCQAEMTKHVDENKDHKCDNGCSVAIGDHVDADKDHKCDYGCSEAIGEHADADKDHNCDYGCSEKIGSHTEDANKDHNCDYCGAKISECTWGEWVVTTEATKRHDGEEQRICSYCGAVETRVIPEIPGLTAVAIVGIVAGSVAVAGGIGFAVYYFVFKKKTLVK